MIPKWQVAGLIILAFAAIGLGIASSPNSYAYLFLSGQCRRDPMPAGCLPSATRVPSGFNP